MPIKKAKNIYNNIKLWTEELGTGKKTIRGMKLRRILKKYTVFGFLKDYESWIEANESVVAAHEQREPRIWREYISDETKRLIEQRDAAVWYGGEEAGKPIQKLIKKQVEKDKENWADMLTQENLGEKELWQGIGDIKREYCPNRFAREDIMGNIVDLDDRAEATKEYLEKVHWGKKEITSTEKQKERDDEIKKLILEQMQADKERYKNRPFNLEKITIQ